MGRSSQRTLHIPIVKVIQTVIFWAPTETTNILCRRNFEFFSI